MTVSCPFPQTREAGRRLNIIIVAEGAKDVHGNSITANQVTKVSGRVKGRVSRAGSRQEEG